MSLTHSPRVVGTLRPDFHSLETFLEGPAFKGKQGEDLVLALYNYLTSKQDGTYHFWPTNEGEGNPRKRRSVTDPVKLLNAYGWAICGQNSWMMDGLYRAAGMPSRQLGLPGHSLCEVYYDGRWHILDIDMWTWFRTPEGHVASGAELAQNAHQLILENENKSAPCNLPDRSLENYAAMYDKTEVKDGELTCFWPRFAIRGHTMDFRLRPGETLIRSQRRHGRIHMSKDWVKSTETFSSEWVGHPRERYAPHRTYGNGRWIYAPVLGAGFVDVDEGLWEPSDLSRRDDGLGGPGSATFRILSPYPFCGIPQYDTDGATHSDGVTIEVDGQGEIRVEVTDAEGNWREVIAENGSVEARADISQMMCARYECLLRFTLGEGALLKSFRFDGYTMTAPISLPRLVEGENQMELRAGDKLQRQTVPWTHVLDFRENADLPSQCAAIENATAESYNNGMQALVPKGNKPASATVRLTAPAGRPIAWLYVAAIVSEGPSEESVKKASIEWSADGETWQQFAEDEITNTPNDWDCTVTGEVVFPEERSEVLVRVISATAISGLEFYGHVVEQAQSAYPLEVVHSWQEGGEGKSFAAPVGKTSYSFECGVDPRGHTIEMSVPAGRK